MSWYLLGVLTQQAIDALPNIQANELEDICIEFTDTLEFEDASLFCRGQDDYNRL